MNRYRVLGILILLLITIQGYANNYSDCDSITFEHFKTFYDIKEYKGDTLRMEFDQPNSFRLLDNKHFIYNDRSRSPVLLLVDLDSLNCIGYINAGFGDYEILTVRDIQVLPDSIITVHDSYSGKLFSFNREQPMLLKLQSINKFNKNIAFNLTKFGDNDFIYTGNNNSKYVCHIINPEGVSQSFSTIPEIPKDDNIEVYEYDIQSKVIWNNKKERLITAALGWDIVSIYDKNLELIKRFRGPVFIDRKLRDNKGVTHVAVPDVSGLIGGIQLSDSGFTVGYGGELNKQDQDTYYIDYIMNFDWEGNPLSYIEIPEKTLDYAYNIDSGDLLLLMESDNNKILVHYILNTDLKLNKAS